MAKYYLTLCNVTECSGFLFCGFVIFLSQKLKMSMLLRNQYVGHFLFLIVLKHGEFFLCDNL